LSPSLPAEATQPDEDLLLRLRCGDKEAFLALYRRHKGPIYRFALRMSGSPSLAEDVTQEVFLVLIREDCGYDPARGALSAYLFGIARNLVLAHLARGRGNTPLEDLDENAQPELSVPADTLLRLTRKEGVDALLRTVLLLPPHYRAVVVLCDLEEVDYADAALALACSIGTVRSRLHRARVMLFERLQCELAHRPRFGVLRSIRSLS
jgi:RNA polymerase sigma-70 factor, ECF subfamily